MASPEVKLASYDFDPALFDQLSGHPFAKDLWPLVYILSDGTSKMAYVGETTDAYARMSAHLKHPHKSKLSAVHLISSEKFNKSATLDIEANLIKYMSGDQVFQLLNGNLGLANHNYYQKKEVYWDVFTSLWDLLRAKGITKHSLSHLDNSDLFKYSPYKSLTAEQSEGLLELLRSLASGSHSSTLIEGGAGTGKTILALFLFKMLCSQPDEFSFKDFGAEEQTFVDLIQQVQARFPNPKIALVVPMSSFRTTLKRVFKNIKGLNANMVIGPAEVSKEKYDLLVVDEAHRLRRRVNLGAYFGAFDKSCEQLNLEKHTCSELDWVTSQAQHTVLFYDATQSIKPSDVKKEAFDLLKSKLDTNTFGLKSQFRVKGGNAYVDFVQRLLHLRLAPDTAPFASKDYAFTLFDSLETMVEQIQLRDQEIGLSRLIAGYSWEWKSNKDSTAFDIQVDGVKLKWNGTAIDWINTEGSVNEVGCIHTTQGYDLNYSGIIFGHEIGYDPVKKQIVIRPEHYYDKNGKQSIKDPEELKSFILNIYQTILLRGIRGTYIYACDPQLREYFRSFVPSFAAPAARVGLTFLTEDIRPFENALPFYDLKVAAGSFSEVQSEEEMRWVALPDGVRPSSDLFVCQVIGESMNKVISNGTYCLFRKYSGGSRNGQIVLVESTSIQDTDYGSRYTIKEYESKKSEDAEGWKHQSIVLKPLSTAMGYMPIVLEADELKEFRVIGVFDRVLA
jgi:DUF2075 family protein/SOS-response transcriptional repressor LexA/predicted GIY-YIG superfamily endonuclease